MSQCPSTYLEFRSLQSALTFILLDANTGTAKEAMTHFQNGETEAEGSSMTWPTAHCWVDSGSIQPGKV